MTIEDRSNAHDNSWPALAPNVNTTKPLVGVEVTTLRYHVIDRETRNQTASPNRKHGETGLLVVEEVWIYSKDFSPRRNPPISEFRIRSLRDIDPIRVGARARCTRFSSAFLCFPGIRIRSFRRTEFSDCSRIVARSRAVLGNHEEFLRLIRSITTTNAIVTYRETESHTSSSCTPASSKCQRQQIRMVVALSTFLERTKTTQEGKRKLTRQLVTAIYREEHGNSLAVL